MAPGSNAGAVDQWCKRATALESVLVQAGRLDLLPALGAVHRLVLALGDAGPDWAPSLPLLSRAFLEIKSAIVDPTRVPDAAVWAALDRAADDLVAPVAPESRWADGLLASLGAADDAALAAIVASVEGPRTSSSRRASLKDELGTLREPLVVPGSEGQAPARVLMKGELQPGLLADLIQLFAQNAETGRLVIEGGGVSAFVFFKEGKIVDSECGHAIGEKAFFQTMLIREGRFSYQRGVLAKEVRIFRSAQHLLMDTLRLIDEGS